MKTENIEAMESFRDENALLHNDPSVKYLKTIPLLDIRTVKQELKGFLSPKNTIVFHLGYRN